MMKDHSEVTQATVGDGSAVRTNGKGMSGRLSDLGLSFVVLTIPMLLFSVCLIGLVFHFRLTPPSKIFENLYVDGQDNAGVYYINLSATFLVFIASWSSSLARALTGFALTLFRIHSLPNSLSPRKVLRHSSFLHLISLL